ncbi:unnamed protein product [Bursaphelenchus okinawaensis]|uniref:Uncharacterized protein n=1 Tax=Bursaphelenchus okinawaensis TaxID=465554 RepID=A0A811JSP8_9BILA|nr:unnamed protein product [Bursaphelenchus okinawaensis]CAG9081918.1 unnamed protein product [Bursaphelenchus okinawaensis]
MPYGETHATTAGGEAEQNVDLGYKTFTPGGITRPAMKIKLWSHRSRREDRPRANRNGEKGRCNVSCTSVGAEKGTPKGNVRRLHSHKAAALYGGLRRETFGNSPQAATNPFLPNFARERNIKQQRNRRRTRCAGDDETQDVQFFLILVTFMLEAALDSSVNHKNLL